MCQGVGFDFKRTNLQKGAGSEQRAEGLAAEKSGNALGRTDAEGLRGGRRTEEDMGPPRNRCLGRGPCGRSAGRADLDGVALVA